MRRGMLLLVGLGGCLALLWVLGSGVASVYSKPDPGIRNVEGTSLEVLNLVSYDGPFWEDGSDREVVDIAALLVENHSENFAEQGALVVDWGEDRFVFEFSWLPPHSRTLLLESSAKAYACPESYACYGWAEESICPKSPVTVTAEGMIMSIYNPTGETLPQLTVRYKQYHPESETYIGGITYSASVYDLHPRENRLLCPHHFSAQGSSIVYVTAARCQATSRPNVKKTADRQNANFDSWLFLLL